jgi:dolichol-phosphate mannosyltransferase
MDADLQHDATILPDLVRRLDDHDVAIGSRYVPDGGTSRWSRIRERQSRLAAWASRRLRGVGVQDPLSGYFVMRRSVYESVASCLRPRGFKILLEILATLDDASIAEVPFTFRPRHAGTSKLDHRVMLAWWSQLMGLRRERRARLAAGRVLPRPVLREALA